MKCVITLTTGGYNVYFALKELNGERGIIKKRNKERGSSKHLACAVLKICCSVLCGLCIFEKSHSRLYDCSSEFMLPMCGLAANAIK